MAEKFGERNLFVGPPRAQATSEYFHRPELVAVTDLASAQRAIDAILEQGEGARGHWQDAHFGQFVQILARTWAFPSWADRRLPRLTIEPATERAPALDEAA